MKRLRLVGVSIALVFVLTLAFSQISANAQGSVITPTIALSSDSGTPVGVEVKSYDSQGRPIGSCKTGGNGACPVPAVKGRVTFKIDHGDYYPTEYTITVVDVHDQIKMPVVKRQS